MELEKQFFDQILTNSLIQENSNHSNQYLAPQIITNQPNDCLWQHLKYELLHCKEFKWAVAFITRDMLTPLKVVLKELATKGVHGALITGTYLGFNEPAVFRELMKISNLDVRIVTAPGFHAKGYFFDYDEYQTAYIGSANFTRSALIQNQEWNLRLTSMQQGQFIKQLNMEFERLQQQSVPLTYDWIDEYQENYIKPQRLGSSSRTGQSTPIAPNKMQAAALNELNDLYYQQHASRGLIVSATGTGKTYLAALWTKRFKPHRFLFVVHREQILLKAKESFYKVIGGAKNDFGILSGNQHHAEAKYVFATVQTISQMEKMKQFAPDEFDLIIIDEAHHAAAKNYQALLNYFKPQFWLGMTATPERMDNQDVFQLFDYNLAYEIRLQDALENNMLCPFHYVGVADYEINGQLIDDTASLKHLTATERVDYVLDQLDYYGDNGQPTAGLVFCSRTAEATQLAEIFMQKGHPARALTNQSSATEREKVIALLEKHQIEYIITVDLFNEGVDIPCLNQIVMLRSTQSSIVFTQQLGRGLRKYPGKDFVTVIDFIGNYRNNYLIPIALYGDNDGNPDRLKTELLTEDLVGVSTINFTSISKQVILDSLAKVKLNSLQTLKGEYLNLKQQLGRAPLLMDYQKFGTVSARPFIENPRLNNYAEFLKKMGEKVQLSEYQNQVLTFITKELANGKRAHELIVLRELIEHGHIAFDQLKQIFNSQHIYVNDAVIQSIVQVLSLAFFDVKAGKTTRKAQYGDHSLIQTDLLEISLSSAFKQALTQNGTDFKRLVNDAIKVGLDFNQNYNNQAQFTLDQSYSRKDVCRLLNWEKDVSAPLYGYRVTDEVCPIFITYHKSDDEHQRSARYQNDFTANSVIKWYTRSPRHLTSDEVQKLLRGVDQGNQQTRIEIFIKRNDAAGKEFNYVGEGKIIPGSVHEEKIASNRGREKAVVAMEIRLKTPLTLAAAQKITD